MKRFEFPFERALEYRESKADQERMRLEQLHAVRGKLEQDQSNVAAQIHSASAQRANGVTSAEDLRMLSSFVSALRQQETSLQDRVSQCSDRIEQQSQVCVGADRDRKLLSQLKGQRLAAWEYEVEREREQTATDLWLAGYARRASASRTDL